MKFAYYDDFQRLAEETEKRTDITEDEKEKMILEVYAENGGICGMKLLHLEESENND